MARCIKKLFVVLVLCAGIGSLLVVLKRRRDESMPGRASAAQWAASPHAPSTMQETA
jgi:hypothetical protein